LIELTGTERRGKVRDLPDRHRSIRVYAGLRTAHLERFPHMEPAQVLYTGTRYDFDENVADRTDIPVQSSRVGVLKELLRHHHSVVEINEPAMVGQGPYLLAQVLAIRARSLLLRRPSEVTAYCIANADPALELRARWRLPLPLGRVLAAAMLRALVRNIDRLAFGTTGSLDVYRRYVSMARLDGKARMFEALPSPCSCLSSEGGGERHANQLVFVGSLTDRKGVRQTMAAWDITRVRLPTATLRILGKGPLLAEVMNWAAVRPEVTVEFDPPRPRIHQVLRQSAALILLSQRHSYWREQIGLPIVEGLGHGCEIITTSETGLADWLARHGHSVLAPEANPVRAADAIAASFSRAATRSGSLADLPATDQRIVADRWMMRATNDHRGPIRRPRKPS
jgi:glycosyltransferase involved in cell wall biosynthesis